jgi:prepilin-type N-terminal cleavage/methylation domain-containing protein
LFEGGDQSAEDVIAWPGKVCIDSSNHHDRETLHVGQRRSRSLGTFTLLELVVVVAIISILAAIVVPSYQEYITRGRRTDATAALMETANLQTRFFYNKFR